MDLKDFDADPELGGENDPEYEAEMFATYRYLGWKPEDLKDADYAARYAQWLQVAPPVED